MPRARHAALVTVPMLAFAAADSLASYTVFVSAASPPVFSLQLPRHRGVIVETRTSPSEVKLPRCGDRLLRQVEPGRWSVPAACRQIQWNVSFSAPDGTEAALKVGRHNVAFPGWWSVMEQNALLRVAGNQSSSTMIIRNGSRVDRVAYVPSVDDATEFYALGNIQRVVHMVDGVRVRYVADDLRNIEERQLLERHAESLQMLRRLFPSPAAPFANELLVMVVGNSTSSGVAGVMGARSLVVDYPRNTDERDAFVFAALAHEQFHQLRALNAESSGHSTRADVTNGPWLEEGLAQYYGLKAVRGSQLAANGKATVWNAFIDPQREVSTGLLELNRRFLRGDESAYAMFYSQGATFFAELDRILMTVSGGRTSLDSFVPTLRASSDGKLPDAVTARWRTIAGTHIDNLLARYVGE